MLVPDRMTPNPVTILPTSSLNDPFALMRRNRFRRMPAARLRRRDSTRGETRRRQVARHRGGGRHPGAQPMAAHPGARERRTQSQLGARRPPKVPPSPCLPLRLLARRDRRPRG